MTDSSPVENYSLKKLLQRWVNASVLPARDVTGLCLDSRRLVAGDLFFALSGNAEHGMRHARQAINAGACAVVFDPDGGGAEMAAEEWPVPVLPLPRLNQKIGWIADQFNGAPSSALEVIAITGTNGKTSCSHFLAQLLGELAETAVIGTLGWGRIDRLQPISHTTPHALDVHRYLAALCKQGVRFVAMEASSHGLEQGRLNGVRFTGALFTNLSRDHLDYHGDMNAYLDAKLRLLESPGLGFVVFNLDDDSAQKIMERSVDQALKIGFTRRAAPAANPDVHVLSASSIRHTDGGIEFVVEFNGRSVLVNAPVHGDFNVENLLACLAVLLARGEKLESAGRRLARVKPVSGRMEFLRDARGVNVVVDYAHTPDALEKLLRSLKLRHGKLIAVIGCGGDRDRGKRPQMGAIAEQYVDRMVLTDDNPRFEDGAKIIEDILAGCKRHDHSVVRDRFAAIRAAIEMAEDGDTVVIAGKGHEATQETAGVRIPFNDKEVVRQIFREMSRERSAHAAF
ncbi:UDP-N-acetylmuramoyl-L-alanyl-D-glutamate--2,6-diaminopimelate ligase [Candidatus Methylospira mobilis]|uniref:UDP-N-acetylmuramoyl-L-alanyl-D-glutamate--2,6-diaminopimelate ligase n=1 Tax=Candidatus Methylospira mobilis TaxID=1808979 RepID=A0A5Q0BIJ9_9GAMM|nr:UDP-N-acetylmuramoyl-L-alanyl-D-glutamate--2,6-diaminopimelate ligase [Candidatus Methylospira mobilis]QFY42031.1 UDP-N-acetylmuramoyl-L-alanyl-D-glutamate--2,6-diaminopimelate ligase [Candidatus Methylospira mobilis]WNV03038.1 UDP-N-acetylmuramoyl-L-alanyl-D-glutamate--2,6-diaminopimelate ligase [Candidatus Methylospira mobilis]